MLETKRDVSLIPGLERPPGEEHGNPLHYFLPGEFHGQRSLAIYSPGGCQESDKNEVSQHVTVPGAHTSDSVIRIRVSILPQTPLPSGLLYNMEQSSLCYAVGPSWLSALSTAVCRCLSQTP